jgi:hypothetical protein
MQFRVTDKDASAQFPIKTIDLLCDKDISNTCRRVGFLGFYKLCLPADMVNEAFPEVREFVSSSFTQLKQSRINVDIHSMMKGWKAASNSHMSTAIGNWWERSSGKLFLCFIIISSGKN